ncbi:MAG: hypothetical protein AAGA66_17395 [Bacteroidota bacterium]
MNKSTDIEQAKKTLIKMIEDKKAVRAYLKGEIDHQALKDKGIKLATPV